MVKMACHCREDAATVQLLTAIISAVISPSRLAGMCHRRLVPVVLRIARQPYDHEDRQTLHIIFQNHRCRGRVVSRYGRLTAIMLLAAQSGHVQEMSSPLAGVPPCGPEGRLTVALYCVAALAELNGTGGVSLGDLRFSGELDWQPPE